MIQFKDVTIGDKELILSYTYWGERQNCDLSFSNIISWRFLYGTQYAIVADFLVFRFFTDTHLAYMMPLPKPRKLPDGTYKVEPCDECSAYVLIAIREDAVSMGHPFLMLGVCNYMRDIIEKYFPDDFDIKTDRDYSDYIYTRDKLINLSGKKLQSKRNHINRFKTLYPQYVYRELTPELIPQCLQLENLWRRQNEEPASDDSLSAELRSITTAFDNWNELGLIGGTIFVDDKLVAFTYGCPINHCTFDVCTEKADVSYEGAFNIINQEFVKHLPENFFFINREEDMGNEGLRKAKLSYKPDILLEKNVIMEKHPLKAFEDQRRIKEEVKQLWREVFKDPEPFVNLYFSRVYQGEYNYCSQIGNHVRGALQALPYTMLYHGHEVKTVYISGVSTHPDWRQRGIGAAIMQQAHYGSYFHDIAFATLIPAEDWLVDWYKKFGYACVITCTPPPADPRTTTFDDFDRQQRSRKCILLHDRVGYDIIKEDIRLSGSEYQPPTENKQAMLRIINAGKALSLYAAIHPEVSMAIKIYGDTHIYLNNKYYIVDNGKVKQTNRPCPQAKNMSIEQLAVMVFKDENATMNLMLN